MKSVAHRIMASSWPPRRLAALGAAALMAALTLAGCSERDTLEEEVLGYIDATEPLSNRYVYEEEVGERTIVVRGLVEDDFRYKARLTIDDTDVLDEVISDDAIAVRFLDPSVLPTFFEGAGAGGEMTALAQRLWVVDPTGAPPVGLPVADPQYAGVDPVVDSLAVLQYTRQAVTEGGRVVEFNPESVSYNPREDPFPTPAAGSGIDRYDVHPPTFPKADATAQTGAEEARYARLSHFRKLSVYVKDGVVVQVRERIAAEGRVLDDFERYFLAFSESLGPNVRSQVERVISEAAPAEKAALLINLYNFGLSRAGQQPIRFRNLTYELRDVGARLAVGLPTQVVEGDLSSFGVNAVAGREAAGAGDDKAGPTQAAETSPSAAAPAP